MMKRAFSLVELSIVLVILGLLVGGILAGQSLIRASELQAVGAEYQRFNTATMAFRDKYFGFPGDISNATAIWGFQGGNGCTNNTGSASNANGACDGNGSGSLSNPTNVAYTGEVFQYWRQLSLAGLVEGKYSGFPVGTANTNATDETNCPPSKLGRAFWHILYAATYSSTGSVFDGDYGNHYRMAGYNVDDLPKVNVFRPEEMWNIDTKLDDGKPGLGRIVVRCSGGIGACTTTTNTTAINADYLLTNNTIAGSLIFRKLF